MKILIYLLACLAITQAIWARSLTEEDLQLELADSKSIWLVHRSCKDIVNLENK
jgi:hypothetical protein